MKNTQRLNISTPQFRALAVLASLFLMSVTAQKAQALDNIIRPYWSARTAGMGGVRLTTGLYDDNFFGNPARVTQNPKWRVTILDTNPEFNSGAVHTVSDLVSGGGDVLSKIADSAGTNNHLRVENAWPAVYIPPVGEDGKMGYAFGLFQSIQADVDLRRSFQLDPTVIADIGPAFTVGRKFTVADNELSAGITTHFLYRLATKTGFSLTDLIKGTSISPTQSGGEGASLDFDLGGYYKLPVKLLDFDVAAGAAINNILGGKYSIKMPVTKVPGQPMNQPRSLGFGGNLHKDRVGPFTNFVAALEMTDIGNNANGGMFRLIHIGAEGHFGVLEPRLGINQGYLCAGLGIDGKVVFLDLATYGEEMSLNPGGLEDRRYTFHLGFKI